MRNDWKVNLTVRKGKMKMMRIFLNIQKMKVRMRNRKDKVQNENGESFIIFNQKNQKVNARKGQNENGKFKQARKPRSYASPKLRLTYLLTGVKCRATSVAKKPTLRKPD